MVIGRESQRGFGTATRLALIAGIVCAGWLFYSFAAWFVSPSRSLPPMKSVESGPLVIEGASAESVEKAGLQMRWNELAGRWVNADAGVGLLQPDVGMNLLVLNIDKQASIRAVVSGFSYCGVVANVSDKNNYVGLFRASPFHVWNVIQFVNGVDRMVGKIPDEGAEHVTIELRVVGQTAWTVVAGKVQSFNLGESSVGNSAGIAQEWISTPYCNFADLVVSGSK